MQRAFISLEEQIFDWSRSNPNKIALVDKEIHISYHDLSVRIQLYAYVFRNVLKLKEKDVVLVIAERSFSFIATYFALHLNGIIAVIIDPEVSVSRFNFIKEKTNAKILIRTGSGNFFNENVINIDKVVSETDWPIIDYDCKIRHFPSKDELADLIFTTGTTGIPKGVFLTHENISASAKNINTFIQNGFEDIELVALPLSHSFGLGRIRSVLSSGGTIVLSNGFSNVKQIFRLIEKYKVTGLSFVPAAVSFMLKMSGDKISEYANQLRYMEIGSAPMSIENKKYLISLLPNTRICMHYGLTEASRSTFLEFSSDSNNLETIGKASPNVEVCIMDESGNSQPIEVEGEICIKGSHVARNYMGVGKQGLLTLFWQDFLRSGDYGILTSDGYLKLVGRKSDIINVGGKKVHPSEIEDVLNSIEHIEESACIGIPDPHEVLGEVVRAYLKGKSELVDIENVKKIITSLLESYKCPVEYIWVEEIPKTESGKLKRAVLKSI